MAGKPVQVIPYLTFKGGCCEEALEAYREAFGGEILYMSRWPAEGAGAPPEQVGKVMHVEFTLGSTRLAAGDTFDTQAVNTDIRLMVHLDNQEEARQALDLLAKGGEVLSPLRPHPAPDDGGCGSLVRDRFGFTWIITCPNPAKAAV